MPELTNHGRAQKALEALRAYAEQSYGSADAAESDESYTALKDLLADLQHLADLQGHDFWAAMYGAEEHYKAEIEEEGSLRPGAKYWEGPPEGG